jgi:hypothetical protein
VELARCRAESGPSPLQPPPPTTDDISRTEHLEEVLRMKKFRDSLAGWKPLAYSATTLLAVLLAAGAKWRPN